GPGWIVFATAQNATLSLTHLVREKPTAAVPARRLAAVSGHHLAAALVPVDMHDQPVSGTKCERTALLRVVDGRKKVRVNGANFFGAALDHDELRRLKDGIEFFEVGSPVFLFALGA